MVVKAKGVAKSQNVDTAEKTEIQWLIDRNDGASNFEMRKFKISPGGRIPRHYHEGIEHEQYVLAGHYEVGIGEDTFEVGPGDSLFIPAGAVHWYRNKGAEEAEFLCVIPKVEKYNATYLKEEERPRVRK